MRVQDDPDIHPRPPPDHISLASRKSSRDGDAQPLPFSQRRVIRGERAGTNREIDDRWELDAEGSAVANPIPVQAKRRPVYGQSEIYAEDRRRRRCRHLWPRGVLGKCRRGRKGKRRRNERMEKRIHIFSKSTPRGTTGQAYVRLVKLRSHGWRNGTRRRSSASNQQSSYSGHAEMTTEPA